jgi:hypothetical protein
MVCNIVRQFPNDQYVNINSNIAEIWRWFNGQPGVQMPKSNDYEKVGRAIGLDREKIFNYNLASLVYWENRMARWLTDVWLFQELAYDTFNPYNSRKIIATMLSIPLDFHTSQEIHEYLIQLSVL